MRILLASVYHISKYSGGNEQYLHYLALGLIRTGHQISYITSSANRHQLPYQIIQRPIVKFFNQPLPGLSWIKKINIKNYDIFHASGSGLPLLISGLWFKSKIPTILTYQAPTNPVNPLFKLPAKLERKLIPYTFKTIITTTQNYQKKLREQWVNNHIYFIPMMVPQHILNAKTIKKSKANRKIILFVGCLSSHHYYKDLPTLLKSLTYLKPNFHLLIIGEGNKKGDYQNLTRNLKIDHRVTFLNHIPNNHLASYYLKADVVVLPSNSSSEGFCLVLIEAMALGIPTITTNVIGSAYWFKKERVTTLIPPNSPKLLAGSIKKVCKNPDLTQIKRAQIFARKFTMEVMVRKTVKVYEEAQKDYHIS